MDKNQATNTVIRIGQMNFEGNILPPSWLTNIQTEAGKPDSIGAILLSDIIYWYRPTEVRDEATGQVVGYKKKFRADKLQRSYDQLASQFGYSKNQVRRALKRLEEQGLITIEFRNIATHTGLALANVMFVEPMPERIREITYKITNKPHNDQLCPEVSTNLSRPSPQICPDPPHKFVETYTETTTETTTESIKPPADLPSITTEEREILRIIRDIPNYPFDYQKDLEHIRKLSLDYPDVDFLSEIKKWEAWLLDKPLKKRSNPRLQIRNWMANATRFKEQKEQSHGISDEVFDAAWEEAQQNIRTRKKRGLGRDWD